MSVTRRSGGSIHGRCCDDLVGLDADLPATGGRARRSRRAPGRGAGARSRSRRRAARSRSGHGAGASAVVIQGRSSYTELRLGEQSQPSHSATRVAGTARPSMSYSTSSTPRVREEGAEQLGVVAGDTTARFVDVTDDEQPDAHAPATGTRRRAGAAGVELGEQATRRGAAASRLRRTSTPLRGAGSRRG